MPFDIQNFDQQQLMMIAGAILAACLVLLFLVRRRPAKSQKSIPEVKIDKAAATDTTPSAPTPAKDAAPADATPAADTQPLNVASDDALVTAEAEPARTMMDPASDAQEDTGQTQMISQEPMAETVSTAPAAAPDLSEIGVYTPHFNFDSPDGYKTAIKECRAEQSAMASNGDVLIAGEGDMPALEGQAADMAKQMEKLALRAFNTDCEAAIANVQWNNIEAMEARIERAASQIAQMIAMTGKVFNPAFVALKVKDLRLTHEWKEKQKQEADTKAALAEAKKEEAALAKAAVMAQKDEQKAEKALDKAKQQAQKASGEAAFEAEAEVARLTQELEAAHAKAEQANSLVTNNPAGFVYVLSNVGSFGEGIFKVGMTRRADTEEFVKELGGAGVPFRYDTHAMIFSEDAASLRDQLIAAMADKRINKANAAGTFFATTLDEIAGVLQTLAPDADISSDIEAQAYHETLAAQRSDA